MTPDELLKLKNSLPKKFLTILCSRTKFSKSQVFRTLNGKQENNSIIDEAIKLAEETKSQKHQISQRIKNL